MAPIISVMAAFSYSTVKNPRRIAAVLVAHILFELAVLNTSLVFYIDKANVYHRSHFYWVYILIFSISIIYCFINIVREELKYYRAPAPVLVATLAFVAVGIGIQMYKSNLRVDYMCVAMGNFLLYNHRCKMIFQLDGLTHLLNRRCYEKDIEKIGTSAVIVNMDVNNFKQINDTYGHSTGDYYLKLTAKTIRSIYGRYGNCYRCGGDEFCVILIKHTENLQKLNKQFAAAVDKLQQHDNKAPDISIGYAYYNPEIGQIKNVIEEADEMMYKNKNRKQKICPNFGQIFLFYDTSSNTHESNHFSQFFAYSTPHGAPDSTG